MRNFKNYIYLDEKGINNLYSQLHDKTIDKMIIKKMNR